MEEVVIHRPTYRIYVSGVIVREDSLKVSDVIEDRTRSRVEYDNLSTRPLVVPIPDSVLGSALLVSARHPRELDHFEEPVHGLYLGTLRLREAEVREPDKHVVLMSREFPRGEHPFGVTKERLHLLKLDGRVYAVHEMRKEFEVAGIVELVRVYTGCDIAKELAITW